MVKTSSFSFFSFICVIDQQLFLQRHVPDIKKCRIASQPLDIADAYRLVNELFLPQQRLTLNTPTTTFKSRVKVDTAVLKSGTSPLFSVEYEAVCRALYTRWQR